jgi:hypothetical protein
MAAPAPVAGSHSTFAAGPEASRGQNGQTMLQVTPILVPPEKQLLAWGAAAAQLLVPQDTRAEQEKRTSCTSTDSLLG